MASAEDWAAFRQATYGDPYLVWHDGPEFDTVSRAYREDPERVTDLLAVGIEAGDGLPAETIRELRLSESQRAGFVSLLTSALPLSRGSLRVECAATLFALTADQSWADPIADVLVSDDFWGVRIDAARRLEVFAPTEGLVDALASGVRDPEYLVRYHCANTLLGWAGRPADVSTVAEFGALTTDSAPSDWADAARSLTLPWASG